VERQEAVGADAARRRLGLPREERLRRRPDFLRVQRRGSRTRGRFLTLVGLPNETGASRLGIVAPRRLGKAVVRNRSKRRVRELFRHLKPARSLDLVVLPQRDFWDVPFTALLEDYRRTLDRQLRSHRRS